MHLIVPVCGDSTRYPGDIPKWLLTHPNGDLMFFESIRLLDLSEVEEVVVICREDHHQAFGLDDVVARQFERGGLGVRHRLVVIGPTASQPETVARGIGELGLTGPVMIKDADNRFRCPVRPGNVVATMDLAELDEVNAANKSYAEVDDRGRVLNIVEKRVISSTFCCGGYGFASAEEFCAFHERLRGQEGLYISHVIYAMMLEGREFRAQPVEAFVDWGTGPDWSRYRRTYATLFIALDGVVVGDAGPWLAPRWGETDALPGVVPTLRRLHDTGRIHIVLTTSRPETAATLTEKQLARLGVPYDRVVYGLPRAQRVLIDSYGPGAPYPTARAVNVPKDCGELPPLLEELLRLLPPRPA